MADRLMYAIIRLMTPNEQITDVFGWMASVCADRPLTQGEIERVRQRWDGLRPEEKQQGWQRCERRFRAAKPTLAQKDRVRHAAEAVLYVVGELR